jgi:hypothetical protein
MFINETVLCCDQMIVPNMVTLLFLMYIQGKLLFEGFRDLHCKFAATELAHIIWLMMKLCWISLNVFDCSSVFYQYCVIR